MGKNYSSKCGGYASEVSDSASTTSTLCETPQQRESTTAAYWKDPEKGGLELELAAAAAAAHVSHEPVSPSSTCFDDGGSLVVRATAKKKTKKKHTLRNIGTLAGGFLAIAATGGMGNAVGLLQRYWEDHQLREYSPRDVGWIAGTSICLSLFLPVVAGPVFDRYGHFWIMVAGTLSFCGGLLSVSFLDETVPAHLSFGMLVLSWGVLCGTGNGLVSTATAGVVCRIFDKRRGLAAGVVSGGNSIGGIVWPMLLRETLDRWGWKWALKTMTGLTLVLLIAGIVLIRDAPPDERDDSDDDDDDDGDDVEKEAIVVVGLERPGREMLRRRTTLKLCVVEGAACFKKAPFIWMTLSLAISQFVIMGIVGTLPSWGDEQGFEPDSLFSLVAVMNAASGVGRVALGAAGDWVGRYNSVIFIQVAATVVVYGLFFNVHRATALFYLFSALWGFLSGAILSMMNVLIREQCKAEDFGRYLSASYSVISIAGLLCVPLSSQMLLSFGPQMHVIFFGSLCAISMVFMLITRWGLMRYEWKWCARESMEQEGEGDNNAYVQC